MTIKLYKSDASSVVRSVVMTLEALKLNYKAHDVNFIAGEHKTPEYLEKNPAHTIPMIEEDDYVLTDSHAIITYLVSKYGDEQQSKLYPSDLRTRGTINQRLFFEATILNTASSAIVYGILHLGQTEPSRQQIEAVNASYEILDRYLQKTKFVACDHVTVADISCVAGISSTELWVPVDDKFTKVKAWLNTLKEEDWYKKGNLPGLTQYKAFMNNFINALNTTSSNSA